MIYAPSRGQTPRTPIHGGDAAWCQVFSLNGLEAGVNMTCFFLHGRVGVMDILRFNYV